MNARVTIFKRQDAFSLTELMAIGDISGVLVPPKLLPIVTNARTTEAKLMLKQGANRRSNIERRESFLPTNSHAPQADATKSLHEK